jgi:hypothetical protein
VNLHISTRNSEGFSNPHGTSASKPKIQGIEIVCSVLQCKKSLQAAASLKDGQTQFAGELADVDIHSPLAFQRMSDQPEVKYANPVLLTLGHHRACLRHQQAI